MRRRSIWRRPSLPSLFRTLLIARSPSKYVGLLVSAWLLSSHGRLHSARAIAAWLAQIGAQIGKIVLLYASKAASALIETGSQQRTQKYTGLFNALELLRSTMLADTAHTTAAQFMCALC